MYTLKEFFESVNIGPSFRQEYWLPDTVTLPVHWSNVLRPTVYVNDGSAL